MKKRSIAISLLSILFFFNAWAEGLTIKELSGKWVFVHWAESDNLANKHEVGIIMDFQPNGKVISKKPGGDVTEHYKLNGDTIIYTGKRGDQIWKLVSFYPNKKHTTSSSNGCEKLAA
jgi:hypothetical protein